MITAIVFMSKHGATSKVVSRITESLPNDRIQIFNLADNRNPDISEFDKVLIGGSIHAGMIQKRVKDFCKINMEILLQKEIGLFLCGMLKDQQEDQYLTAFPKDLRKHARAYALPGGEFDFDKMNFFEKAIVKKVSKVNESVSEIDDESVKNFASEMMM